MVLGSLKLYTQLLSSFHQVQAFSFSSTDSIILTGHFITKTNATFCTLNLANSQTGRSQPFCGGMNNSDGPVLLKMQQIYLKASMESEEKLTQEEMLNTLADMSLKTYAATEMANVTAECPPSHPFALDFSNGNWYCYENKDKSGGVCSYLGFLPTPDNTGRWNPNQLDCYPVYRKNAKINLKWKNAVPQITLAVLGPSALNKQHYLQDGVLDNARIVFFLDIVNTEICQQIQQDAETDDALKLIETLSTKLYNGIGTPSKEVAWDIPKKMYENSPIRIDYEPFLDLPHGLQDSAGGFVDDYMISTGGFCGGDYGHGNPNCCGDRGFLATTYALNMREVDTFDDNDNNNPTGPHLDDILLHSDSTSYCQSIKRPNIAWEEIAEFPGIARQGHACASDKEQEMYCWGGFSYSPAPTTMTKDELKNTKKKNPYGFTDGYKLSLSSKKEEKKWNWSQLPALPSHQGAFTALCYSTSTDAIFLVGGGDYDRYQFHTISDRTGTKLRVGAMMWKFSITTQEWTAMPELPGTARLLHSISCVKDEIIVIGGATGGQSIVGETSFHTVVDNWSFNIPTETWKRLKDTPYVIGNFGNSVVYQERYMFLVGGAGYGKIERGGFVNATFWNNDIDKPPHFKHPSSSVNYRKQYSNSMLVYDITLDNFFFTDPLPINNNLPLVYLRGDYIYTLGGETGTGCVFGKMYGQHTELVLRGRIKINN